MNGDTTLAKRCLPLPDFWHALLTNQRMTIHLGFLGAAVLFVHYRTFEWLLQTWWKNPNYSHAFLIPFISSCLVWVKRDQLAQLARRPNLTMGGLFLLVSAIVHLVGRAGGYVLLEAISLLILLPGIVLCIWGLGHLRALMLSLVYLQFMIPWTEEFRLQASLPMQLLSARFGALVLQAMGFSVFREATYLQLPHAVIDVAPYCSGIGNLYAVIALGIPVVYLTQRTWPRAAAVLVFSPAIMFLANGVRVAFAAAVSAHYGESTLHGAFHTFLGFLVFQGGIFLLFLVNWVVTKLPCDSRVKLHERWKGLTADAEPANSLSRTAGSSALLVLWLLGVGCYLHFFALPHPVPPKRSLGEFPYALNGTNGRDSAWIQGGAFFPGADAEVTRTYHTIAGKEIFVYVGYFDSQRQGKSLSTKFSYPIRSDAHELLLPKPIAGLQRVNHSAPTIDSRRYEALFWYHLPSGNLTGRYETKLRQFLDAVIHRRNNGAVVLLATPVSENQDKTAAVNDLLKFATAVAPVLEQYLP
jgi:EpsI family protein